MKQLDLDGKTEYSNVVAAYLKNPPGQESLYPFPNPTTNFTILNLTSLPAQGITINIYDMYGKLVKQCTVTGEDMQQLDLSALITGKYIIEVRSNSFFKVMQVLKK